MNGNAGNIRRPATALVALILAWVTLGPLGPSAEAQSGRKPPEKARKTQPPATPTTPAPQEPAPVEPPLPPLTQKDLEGAIKLGIDVVNVETVVFEKKSGQILQNLKRENFEVYEDGVKQEVVNFAPSQGPVTLVILIEFSRLIENRAIRKREVLLPAYQFISQFVKKDDNVAIVAFDMRPEVITDFTGEGDRLRAGIDLLVRNSPAFSESNLFDALTFVLKGGKLNDQEYGGLKDVESRSAIMLISIGIDTFSRVNYGDTLKLVKSSGVPIYTIGVGNLYHKRAEAYLTPEQNLTWLQSFNTLKSFARLTGGRYFPVTFEGEIPTTMQSISNLLRSQYSLGYSPTNTRREGKERKIKVLVDADGDGKFGDKGFEIQHRESYVEPSDGRKK